MSPVLVTGATGFIGQHVVRALTTEGHEVAAIARKPGTPLPGLSWHVADMLDLQAVQEVVGAVRPHQVIHLAWQVDWSSVDNIDWIGATLSMLRSLADAGCRRVVLAGTSGEYDWSNGVCHETSTPLLPATLYGAAKLAVSSTGVKAADALGMEIAVGRIFFVYGPGQPAGKLVAHVISSLLRGQRASCTPGGQRRDYLHVDDVAGALTALLASQVTGPVNIGSGEAPTLAEIVTMVGDVIGRCDLLGLGDRPTPPGEAPLVVADVTRLHDEVGYVPRTGLLEGIRQTVQWWREVDEGHARREGAGS